jgi:hypothetical protein
MKQTKPKLYNTLSKLMERLEWRDKFLGNQRIRDLYGKLIDLSENKVFVDLTNCFYCLKIYLRTSLMY